MTQLTDEMFQIFDQPEFSFKKIKMQHTEAEVAELKDKFKGVWQTWKAVNQAVAKKLPAGEFAKVHVESWTNGWNLRDHYWASYRLQDWYIWNGEMSSEFDKHTKLNDYLKQSDIQTQFKSDLKDATFLIGKFIFRDQQHDVNMEDFITQAIMDLAPLYENLDKK